MQHYNTNSLTPTKILHLQHTLGNQAVVRLLSPNSAITPGNTIQRTVTQILPGEDGKVGKLLIVGRPAKVFGNSMGDHTTAFATHVEALKLQMEGKTLWEALQGLIYLYKTALTLPGYALKDNLPRDTNPLVNLRTHGGRLDEAEKKLLELLKTLPEDKSSAGKADETAFALTLQQCVNAYLEFRELIPLSAINVMVIAPALAGKGKGEAGYAGILAQHERGKVTSKTDLQGAILGVFDVNAAAMVIAATDDYTLSKLAPGLTTKHNSVERLQALVEQHLLTIQAEFPKSFKAAALDPQELANSIIAQAKEQLTKEKTRLTHRYKLRLQQWEQVDSGIRSGINKTKFYKNWRTNLEGEIQNLKIQLVSIGKLLKEETKLPAKIGDVPLLEEEETPLVVDKEETAKAEEAEEETLEEETKKQPIATQVVLRNDGPFGYNIEKVEVAGRPPSPIPGSMGAHSTAWVVHTDRVSKALTGTSVEKALEIMNRVLVPEAKRLKETLAKAKPPTVKGQSELLAEAWQVLEKRQTQKYSTASQAAFALQQYVNELFIYINYIPGVTREAVDTTGHGEGKHRKVLVEFEKHVRANPITKTKSDPKNKSRKIKLNIYKKVLSKSEYDGLCSAIGGLLDLKGLSNGRTYKKAHYELIQHTYPYAWASIVDYETRTNSFDISQAEDRPSSSESETEKEITPKTKMLKIEVIGMDTTSN